MKKFVATFAALAVVGAAGVMYVNEKMETNAPDEQSTTSPTYVQTDSGYRHSNQYDINSRHHNNREC